VAYNFQTGNNHIKLLTEYESVTQKVVFGNAVLAALMSGRKYDVILQNGDCSRESHRNPDNSLEPPCTSSTNILLSTGESSQNPAAPVY
jgi:hypothetical protein